LRGRSRQVAWIASAVLGAATVVGVLTMSVFSSAVSYGLPLSAGVTLYVAASDLMPEVNKEPGIAMAALVFLGAGVLMVLEHLFR